MTIANCRIFGNVSEGNGGGIYCYKSNVTVKDCVIEDNGSRLQRIGGGGGIGFFHCADSQVLGCTIARNRAGFRGGGIYCYNASPTIRDTQFEGNAALRGAGLAATDVSSPLLENCSITGNQAACGGAIRICHHSNPKLRRCVIRGNSGTASAGGVSLWNASSIELSACEVTGNVSPQGGAVNLCRASMAAVNTTFKNNLAAQGAGVWFHQEADAIISGCTFEGNKPHAFGVRIEGSSLSVAATRFKDQPDGILRLNHSDRTYVTLNELEATFASWQSNAQGDAPLVLAEADTSGLGPLHFPEEPEATSIEITSTETRFLFKGRLAVVAVFVIVLMVVLVAAGAYVLSRGKDPVHTRGPRLHGEAEPRFEPVENKPRED
jgi:hypothetical protein